MLAHNKNLVLCSKADKVKPKIMKRLYAYISWLQNKVVQLFKLGLG